MLQKITNLNGKQSYESRFTTAFRELVEKELGTLDVATVFMYLFRRFEMPTFTNKDEYKILFDYRFKFEDLIISVHGSYYEHVNFSLHLPNKRYKEWVKGERKFAQELFDKNNDIPFIPYQIVSWSRNNGLSKEQKKLQSKLIDERFKKYFPKKHQLEINALIKTANAFTDKNVPNVAASEVYKRLEPFYKRMNKEFLKRLTKEEKKRLYEGFKYLSNVPNLQEQCIAIVNDFKKGLYIRDVQINIKGYEETNNVITEQVTEKE